MTIALKPEFYLMLESDLSEEDKIREIQKVQKELHNLPQFRVLDFLKKLFNGGSQ